MQIWIKIERKSHSLFMHSLIKIIDIKFRPNDCAK